MKHILFIDFESFYDSKNGYSLANKKMSIVQYVRDSRFKSFGAGVIAGTDGKPRWITAAELPTYLMEYGMRFGWHNTAVVGHNIKFDGFILKEVYGITPAHYIDTKGMSKAVLGKTIRGHSLANLAEFFKLESKGVMKTDGIRDLTPEQERELAEYCLHDVELCRDIFKLLALEFPESQYEALHRTVDMFINPKMKLNVDLLLQTSKDEAERRTKIFDEIAGVEETISENVRAKWLIDPARRAKDIKSVFASNAKFPKLLESKGYTVPMKKSPKQIDENGEPVMIPALALGDTEFLELMETANEELQDLCEARVAAKSTLLETRSAKLAKIGATGLWPFDVEFSGADQTHRFSGGPGAGGNPQNFTNPAKIRDPKKKKMAAALRKSVMAPEGYELVVGDFAQIEFRIVAYLSKDPGLIQSIEQNVDIYCDFASVFYGRKITKKDEKERGFGKQAILGLGYGMGWRKFKRTVRIQTGETISDEDAKKAVDLYRTRYAGVKALWNTLDGLISVLADKSCPKVRTNFPVTFGFEQITLPSGLKIRYPNLRQQPSKDFKGQMEWVYDVYNKGRIETRKLYGGKVLENISQAIAGELCKEAMMKMDNVTGLVHDEIHVRCKKGLGLVTTQKLKRVMSVSPKWFPEIRLGADVHVGATWGDAK